MSLNQQMHFKECTPEETVAKLKGILNEIGVEVVENTKRVSEIGTHSMRVVFKGTDFGANGKGVSEAYCTASAYAEFFERYQNDLTPQWKTGRESKYGFKVAFDERELTTAEIISENNAFLRFYFTARNMSNSTFVEKVEAFERIQRSDFWLFDYEGKYKTLPFYSVRDNKIAYLPHGAYSYYYGSNGMCAGNTAEEALVQGMSEIFERIAQRRIFVDKPTLPDVPDEYIKKFPYIFDMLQKIRENKKFICKMKDCSFGGMYPVAALIVLEKNTGRMGIKLGCHPDYGIAMERAITEAAQGSNLYDFVNRSVVDFHNIDVDSDTNICNSFKVSAAQFPYQVLGSNPTYEFVPVKDVSMLSNGEILKDWVSEIIGKGYDILIRDVSSFGFPSYHIIIPGLSELQDANDMRFKALHTKMFVQTLLEHPEKIDKSNVRYIIATLNYFHRSLLENNISQYFAAGSTIAYPGEDIGRGNGFNYMLVMCYIIAGDYSNAEKICQEMYNTAVRNNADEKTKRFYTAMLYYTSSMSVLKSHDECRHYLEVMFDQDTANEICNLLSDVNHLISKQYPCYTLPEDDEKNPYNVVFEVREKLFDAQVKSKINQIRLRHIFQS